MNTDHLITFYWLSTLRGKTLEIQNKTGLYKGANVRCGGKVFINLLVDEKIITLQLDNRLKNQINILDFGL